MGYKTSQGQQPDPAIRETSIEQSGKPRSLDGPAPAGRPWIAAVVAAATVAGLAYGFLLGRGDRPGPPIPAALGTTTTTSTPEATPTSLNPFPETLEAFVRASPGHDLGSGVTEFLNSNRYQALAVDREGIVWAGGSSGIVRLDPSTGEFTRLTGTDGTGPLDTMAISTSSDGTVWAASSRGLSHWDGEAWTHYSRFPRFYPEDRWVTGLEVGPAGEVWLATNTWGHDKPGAARIHRLQDPFAGDMPTHEVGSDVRAIDVAADGTLWAVLGTRLWRYDGAWHEAVKLSATRYTHIIATDEAGDVWLAREDRIRRWNGQELFEVPWGSTLQRDPDVDPSGPGAFVQALAPGIDGDMWGLTYRWGPQPESGSVELIHFQRDGYVSTPLPSGPDPTNPQTLAVAPDGAVWVATETALLLFDGEWRVYSIDDEPPLTSTQSLAVGSTGELWIASYDGILQTDGDLWRRFGLRDFGLEPADESAGEFWVTSAPDGSIWGGIGCRAFKLIDGEWLALPAPPDAPDQCWNVAATVHPDGSLWMSTGCCSIRTPVYRWSGEEWEEMARTGEFLDVAFAKNGEVWLIDSIGVKRFADEVWATVLSGVFLREIAISGDGVVWAAGGAGSTEGLWNYDDDTWTLTRPGEAIHSLTPGPTGEVWALQTRRDGGTDLFELATGRIRFVTDSPTLGQMAIAADGTVWIGGNGRLYRVDPFD